jgi:ribA/ribD-fused uncharacterized protein
MPAIRSSFLACLILLSGCTRPQAGADQNSSPPPPEKIAAFQGPYRFLSNFWPATVEFEGLTYPTVEHAYQSAKTLDRAERRRIAALPTPSDAKKAGRALPLRSDWEAVKFDVMEQCVRYKFTHNAELRSALIATGDAYLEEGNDWGDRVWGVYQGVGENRLGRILMKVRADMSRGD